MDTSDPSLVFEPTGVCDLCVNFFDQVYPALQRQEVDADARRTMVDRIRRSSHGSDFDCIVGVSGGVDSSYLLYVAVEKMGLRPLVFHVDAGWNSDLAVSNISSLVEALDVDLYTEVIDWQEMRDLQLAFFKSGVPHIDTPQDHAFFATMYRFAVDHNVKTILTGANWSTEGIRNPLEWMYFQSDEWQLRDIHRRFGTRKLETFPITSILWHKVYLPYVRGIKVERPLNYFTYRKKDAAELLQKRFGWRPYPQKHFESRFTRFYESYWLPSRFGYDVRKVQFSSLILTGQMTRDEALERLKQQPWDDEEIRKEMEFVARKLEISVDELESYRQLPKKTYRDYRSQRHLYTVGAWAMRAMGLEAGGKR